MKPFRFLPVLFLTLLIFVACAPTNEPAVNAEPESTIVSTIAPTAEPTAKPTATLSPEALVEAMFVAVRENNNELAESHINAGVDVNTPGEMRVKMLDIAIHNGNIPLIKMLIEAGATFEQTTFLAALLAIDDPEIVQVFLDEGADINEASAQAPRHSPLMYAAEGGHVAVGEALLANGADIEQVDAFNDPALNVAAFHGNLEFATMLVESGAELNVVGYGSRTAVGHAQNRNHQEVVDYLLSVGAIE